MTPNPRHACSNHPQTEGRRRCFRCKRYFCKVCYFIQDRHVFCSEECHSEFLQAIVASQPDLSVSNTVEPLSQNNDIVAENPFGEIPTPKAEAPSKPFPKLKVALIAGGSLGILLITGLLLGLLILWQSYNELKGSYDALRKEQTKLRSLAEQLLHKPALDVSRDRPIIDAPTHHSRIGERTIEVTGRYGQNRTLMLVVNGARADTTQPMQGRFSFRRIQLRNGPNVLSVKALFGKKAVSSDSIEIVVKPTASAIKPRFRGELPDYSFDRGNPTVPALSLTFDCDSYANAALEILEILRSRSVKATFFLTGKFIRRYPNFVKLILAEGHEIGNHTDRHPHLTSFYLDAHQATLPDMTAMRLAQELETADAAFMRVTGQHMMPYWRAPYGDYNRPLCAWGKSAGYTHVGWTSYGSWLTNMDTNDWIPDSTTAGYKSPQEVVDKILHFGEGTPGRANGAIILMHLGTARLDASQQVHRSLERIIDGMRQQGYTFVTISEMIRNSPGHEQVTKSN